MTRPIARALGLCVSHHSEDFFLLSNNPKSLFLSSGALTGQGGPWGPQFRVCSRCPQGRSQSPSSSRRDGVVMGGDGEKEEEEEREGRGQGAEQKVGEAVEGEEGGGRERRKKGMGRREEEGGFGLGCGPDCID